MAAVDRLTDWWALDIEGSVERIGDVFRFRHLDIHDSAISFVKNHAEWTGTKLVFEALPRNGGTELVFTHAGLTPRLECYADCAEGWTYFIQESLAALVATGKGKPETKLPASS